MASTSSLPSAAGPSSSRAINPLLQPVPSFARTTRSMTLHNLAAPDHTAATLTAASGSRPPPARRVVSGKTSGRLDQVASAASSSGSGRATRATASSKGKERAPIQPAGSPGGSTRPRKSARRSKDDGGGAPAEFLPRPPAQSAPVAPRRLPRSRTTNSIPSLSSSKENTPIPFLEEPEDDNGDDLNIQPSPRKKQLPVRAPSPPPPLAVPTIPPLSPSRRTNLGVKRSRARAFDDGYVSPVKSPRAPHKTPVAQASAHASFNPFYVASSRASPTPPPSTVEEPEDVFQLTAASGSSSHDVLRLPTPPPLLSKKRARTDTPGSTPLKSCLSSSPLRSGSSEADLTSAGITPKLKHKRVKLTPPGPDTPSAAASYRIEEPLARPTQQDPSRSPPRMPPLTDLSSLIKKFKSPRKKAVRRDDVNDGGGALGIRDFLVALPKEDDDADEDPLLFKAVEKHNMPQLGRFIGIPGLKMNVATPSRLPQPTTTSSIPRTRPASRPGGAAAPTLSSLAKATPKLATKTLTLSKASSLVTSSNTSTTTAPPPSAAPRGRSLYPSSLSARPSASRPVAPLPTARKTSVPLPPPASTSRLPSPRTVSAPILGQGLSAEGRTAMKGLAETLAKLNVRRSSGGDDKRRSAGSTSSSAALRPSLPPAPSALNLKPPSIMGPPSLPVPGRRISGLPAPRRVSANSSSGVASLDGGAEVAAAASPAVSLTDSKSRASLASIALSAPACTALKGVVAYVDVQTAEGDNAGDAFVDMLKNLGARVLTRPTDSVTHIVFKGGRAATLAFYRKSLPRPPAFNEADEDESDEANTSVESSSSAGALAASVAKPARTPPALVGIGWVIRCREEQAKVSEDEYRVDLAEQAVFSKRRKSMEPKAMAAAAAQDAQPAVSVQQSIEQARRRSMQFAPRVGSPLKRAYHGAADH